MIGRLRRENNDLKLYVAAVVRYRAAVPSSVRLVVIRIFMAPS